MKRAFLWRLLPLLASVLVMPAQAGGDHGGVGPGPLTALARLDSVVALTGARTNPPTVSLPAVNWVTAEGVRVYWWQNDQLPMLDVRLVFDAGSARDGELPGLASAVSSLMDEGTRERTGQQVAEGFEQIGAEFGASSYRDMALLQLRVLSAPAQRDPAVALFAEVASAPAFAPEAWARLQESMRIGQRQRQQSPAGRAGLLFYQKLYGSHPYAAPPAGLASSVDRITPTELRDFHARYYSAGNAVMVLVGDIDRASAERVAAGVSKRLLAGARAEPLPEAQPLARGLRLHEEFPSQQMHVLLGEIGITRLDPDYFPLLVGNELLGGSGFGTLLTRELREKRGLTYSVSSRFIPMRAAGPFQISFSTRADQAEPALKLTRQLLRDFVERGPDPVDVQAAIDNLTQAFPRSLANNEQVASFLGMMGFYDLPDDFLDQYMTRLRSVTPAGVQAAIARHLHPDRLLVITVGQKSPPKAERQ